MDDYESVLLVVRECFVYKIPPLGSTKGYKAADWDVNSFMWSGRLRIISVGGKRCFIKLEDSTTGQLFAQCEYKENTNSVEPVIDSSRYFVLRIEDPNSGKHAFIGMGFQERGEAFDFNVALQDFTKHLHNETAPKVEVNTPKVDYSWKEGETININIGKLKKSTSGLNSTKPSSMTKADSSNDSNEFAFLSPPPKSRISVSPPPTNKINMSVSNSNISGFSNNNNSKNEAQNKKSEWADFGDFVGATGDASTPSNWTTF